MEEIDKESRSLARSVAGFCRSRGLLGRGDRVLAAVSGGPDSMAMLDLLCLLGGGMGLEIGVAHLNHGLRGGESDGDRRFVQKAARQLGLRFHAKTVDTIRAARKGKSSIETAAREARKDFLETTARRHGYDRIATGHTRGDQAETVLMRLVRGGGTDGLRGIPAKNGRYIRPLLGTGRPEVLAHLARRGLGYRVDSSNARDDAFRNRIRLELLPLLVKYNPRIEESLARMAEALDGDREALTRSAAEAAGSCVAAGRAELSIELGIFKGYNKGLQRNLIRWCCQRLLGPGRTPDLASTDRALGLADAGRVGQSSPLAGGLWAKRGYHHLHIGREKSPKAVSSRGDKKLGFHGSARWNGWLVKASVIPGPMVKAKTALPNIAFFDLGRMAGRELRIGPTRPGLRMRLFGPGGTRKIQDILVDAKVPRDERGKWPVIYSGDDPIWVPGIRRSDAAPVNGKTKKVLRLEMEMESDGR